MKKIFNYEVTEEVIKVLEEDSGKLIAEVSKDEFEQIIKDDYSIEVIEELNYIFHKEDIENICVIGERYPFGKVEELNIYVWDEGDGTTCLGGLDNTSAFFDFYVGSCNCDIDSDELFAYAKENIYWYYEDNIIYNEFNIKANKIKSEKLGDKKFSLTGDNCRTICLETALKEDEEFEDKIVEKLGCYSGEPIYSIDNTLYYIEDSWFFNGSYRYDIQEVSKEVYSYFGR